MTTSRVHGRRETWLSTVPPPQQAAFADGADAIDDAYRQLTARRARPTPSFHGRALRRWLAAGRSPAYQRRQQQAERRVRMLEQRIGQALEQLRRRGRVPRAVLLYVEGGDACGKTCTAELLHDSLAPLRLTPRQVAFRAPSAEERAEAPIQRFQRACPRSGELMIWDRGPAGNYAYSPMNRAELEAFAGDLGALEQQLAANGVFVLKLYLHADDARRARRLGKRAARIEVAELLAEQRRITRARAAELASLERELGPNDIASLNDYALVHERFQTFVAASQGPFPWTVIDTSNPSSGREHALGALLTALTAADQESTS